MFIFSKSDNHLGLMKRKLRMSKVGSYRWALKTQGHLSRLDRLRLMGQMIKARMLNSASRKSNHGLKNQLAAVNIGDIVIPDTAATRSALDACESLRLPYIFNHSMRTFMYGAIISAQGRLKHDPEFLYCAALLHDVSVSTLVQKEYAGKFVCFACESAHFSYQWAEKNNWTPIKATALATCISLHINPIVPIGSGVEAHLLNAGAALDVAGIRRREVSAELHTSIRQTWPRLDQNENFAAFMRNESQQRKSGRVAWLASNGFIDLIEKTGGNAVK
jgi:hypothetical protein